jgi:hypothetical protein
MTQESVLSLVEKVHFYYPIGIPQIYKIYPGYKMMQKICHDKILGVQNSSPTPWTKALEKISNLSLEGTLHNLSYLQFPNYSASIEVKKELTQGIEITRSIELSVSLLAKYYTIFFLDTFRFLDFGSEGPIHIYPIKMIVYLKIRPANIPIDRLEKIKDIVESCFDGYFYIQHDVLFSYKMEGSSIFGSMEDYQSRQLHSLYEFLFSNHLPAEEITVRE